MSDERETSIRRRAYELWEQGGGDHGRDEEHWHQASSEVDAVNTVNTVAPDGTTIGNGSDTADRPEAAGAGIVDAEVTTPATPAAAPATAAAKPAPRPRKPKTK